MRKNNHLGIILSSGVDKNKFIESLFLNNAIDSLAFLNYKKKILFSDAAIEKIIHEEYRHGTIIVAKETNRKLQTFSSGERKKVFLQYCKLQKPDYLILDNALGHLDASSRILLTSYFEEISKETSIIQIVDKYSDFFNFVDQKLQVTDNSFNTSKILNNVIPKENIKPIRIILEEGNINYEDEILIEFKSVSVQYEIKKVLHNINWTIKKGEFWQLIGPNGSGKSTLLSLINGDNPKAYGQELYLFGKKKGSGESIWEIKEKIGYFNPSMTDLFNRNNTLEDMILSGFFDSIGLYIKPSDYQLKITKQWLSIIGLSHLGKQSFLKLTGGQKTVALIIRAIIKSPLLLILDEPIEGLDDEAVFLVTELINKIISETNTTLIYVSHKYDPRIKPLKVFELIPEASGSRGVIKEF
jgi:molybdate transport system ATP-binding protein